ncbi:PadR family transcriptional regulator [Actinophytocola oryzae]|uniref:Virulence activator alpha n=1 Tax=Actinophytocola oryzae TaxID=502181 RepID=A0A4R7VVJ3_9PSEU|nr:PadR family transcriptional regulator [Actinophytocola oryzae]TDV53648.1 virulence activator alpha [Actinophytocola oryzae]
MSVRYGLLALLGREPMHGYQLRTEFECSTGLTWPLNIGQVYSTLSRLSRDGLIEETDEAPEPGKVVYRLTTAGLTELGEWFTTPVAPAEHPREELAIKVALALSTPGVDVSAVLQGQRTATLRKLRELTQLKAKADDTADEAWLLVLDLMIFRAESEARWLDHSETRLARTRRRAPTSLPVDVQ